MRAMILASVLAAGCSPMPQIDGQRGTVTCATVDTLTTRATTVYLQAERPGTVVVQPDCTVAITVGR